MFEILSLIAVVLAIAALSGARSARARLDTEIAALKLEVKRLEGLLGSGPAHETAAETVKQIADGVVPEPAAASPDETLAEPPAATEGAELAVEEAKPEITFPEISPAKAKESFESRLAARWSVWVGGIALAFAGIFAVKYSIEQGILSPAVRLSLAAVFGFVLMAAGEWVRRRSTPLLQNTFQNALIPGILTAAGTLTLMGAVFVAHSVYGYFGAGTAFVLLCLISLVTLALSLIHGQALAGLGLLASFVTPLLVQSDNPSPWPLFGFLTVAWIGSTYASKLRAWRVAPAIANSGLSIWALAYLATVEPFQVAPVMLPLLIMIAGLALIWPGRWAPAPLIAANDTGTEETPTNADAKPEGEGEAAVPVKIKAPQTAWEQLLLPRHIANTLTAALGVMLSAIVLIAPDHASTGHAEWGFAALAIGLALFGAFRAYAVYPAILSALTAAGGIRIASFGAASPMSISASEPAGFSAYVDPLTIIWLALGLGLFFAALGIVVAILKRDKQAPHLAIWSVISVATPLVLAAIAFFFFGNLNFDIRFGLYAIVIGIAYLGAAQIAFGTDFAGRYLFARDAFIAGSWASFLFALVVMTNGAATTVGASVLGFVYLLGTRVRDWPVLPWAMVAAAVFVAGRIAWQPTIVGADHLSTTPVFNQLLLGYGIPSLLLIVSAWLLRNSEDGRIRSVLEALASLFMLLTIGILVRHAMNGGVLNDAVPTLGEQAIYTLLTIGASTTLMALDLRHPSIIFRTGSMAVGYISMLSVIAAHYVGLNPYVTGELTGRIPFFNLLFLAYLLPGLAYELAAWYARERRPMHYVIALALTGASLLFAYVSLSVRRFVHGEGIAEWKGFLQPELYTYSVVWLLLGIVLLVVGYRFRAKSLRIASAVLVLIAVLKVFLIDMANLEGLFRVLSFIGLGVALIGIGRFYQTILTGLAAEAPKSSANETAPVEESAAN